MALRWSTATGGLLLAATLLGVGCAQGSGSRSHTGPPPAAVLGVIETRAVATAPTTSTTPTALAAPIAANALVAVPDAAPNAVPEVTAPVEDDDLTERTLARISYPWRTRLPGWEIVFLPSLPSLRGLTLPADKRIEIYVRGADTDESLARVVAHELGHAADVTLNDSVDRARWRAARGVDAERPWWPEAGVPDFATVGGDFAEAFAAWQTGVSSLSTVAEQPTDEQLALLALLVS